MAKKIILADSAGVCFGVEKAVSTAEEKLVQEQNVFSYGPLIHNPQTIEKLEKKGLKVLDKIENKKGTIIIRAHGITIDDQNTLESSDSNIVDMTCPIVKKLQFAVKSLHENGFHVLIVGDHKHPEIIGAKSYAKDDITIIRDLNQLNQLPKEKRKIGVVAQTTIPVEDFWKVVEKLKKIKQIELKVIDTLCDDIHNKQIEAVEIAKDVDIMLVIGGKNSSNTKEITKMCKDINSETHQIETFDQISDLNINFKDKVVGISAGASTPPWLIKKTIDNLMMV